MESGKRCGTRTTRRSIVKAGGAIAFTAPIVAASISLADLEASAPEEKKPRPISGNPDPGCRGATCATFIPCGPGGAVCASTSSSGGFGVGGNTACSGLADCPDGQSDCGRGELCVVNSCCNRPVCVPRSAGDNCLSGATAPAFGRPSGPTIGSAG